MAGGGASASLFRVDRNWWDEPRFVIGAHLDFPDAAEPAGAVDQPVVATAEEGEIVHHRQASDRPRFYVVGVAPSGYGIAVGEGAAFVPGDQRRPLLVSASTTPRVPITTFHQ